MVRRSGQEGEPKAADLAAHGLSQRVTREIAAYHESAGVTRRLAGRLLGDEPNDPAKGAAAIVEVLDSENPLLRLVLGGEAVDEIRAHHESLLADITTWEAVSRSTAIS